MREMDYLRGKTKEEFTKIMNDCIGKVEGTNDLDWQDIIDKYDLGIHRDVLRKSVTAPVGGYAIYKFLGEERINDIDDEELLTTLELKEIELKEERVRLSDIRRRLNKSIRDGSRYKSNFENLIEAVNELNNLKPLETKSVYTKEGDGVAILNFSDFHLGIEFKNYFNEFNKDIAVERLEKLTASTIEKCRLNKVSKLHLLINGDLINGMKHAQLVADSDLSVAQTVTKSAEYISNMIKIFSDNFEEVEINFSLGNHSMFGNGNSKEFLDRDNFEYIIKDIIKIRIENLTNVVFKTNKYSDDIADIRIGDKLIIGVHGNKDNPRTVAGKLSTFLDEKPSQILLSHYHHYEEIDQNNISVKVNGSIVSTDSYAFGLRLNSKAYQVLVIFDKEGNEECTYKIKL